MINELIKKLRKAADVLDDLLDQNPSHNGKAKRAILKSMVADRQIKITKKKKSKAKHWTQRPENKKRFAQWKKSMANGRRGKL